MSAAGRVGRLGPRLTPLIPGWAWPILGVLSSLVILAPLVAWAGGDVVESYEVLFETSFGSVFGFGVLLTYSVPLALVGLAVAVPYRAGLFNIGGEGQLIVGAFAAAVVGVEISGLVDWPGGFLVLLVVGASAGAALGAIAGALRAWRGINEIVTTIMLNFIALLLVQYFIAGSFRDPALTFAASREIPTGARIAKVGSLDAVPLSILVAVIVGLAVAYWAHQTRGGWRISLLGAAPAFAREKGVRPARGLFLVLLAGGALGGLAGATELVGNQHRVGFGFSPGWGLDAVAIALLARGNVYAVVPIAVFFAFLRNGTGALQSTVGVSGTLVGVMTALPVLIVAALLGWRDYRRFRQGRG